MKNYPVRPIHFCLNDISNCINLNNDEFKNTMKELLANEKLSNRIKIVSRVGWQEFTVRVRDEQILINECFLTLLWCVSYYTLLTYNHFLVPFQEGENIDYENLKLAQEILNYGMGLKYGDDEWPTNIPHPREVDTKENVYVANFICSIAANFIISHEIAHRHYEHQPCNGVESYKQEYEADDTAFYWLNKEGIELADFTFQMGIFVALFTTLMTDLCPEKGGDRHPSSFSIVENVLNKLKIDDEHQIWALSLIAIGVWNSKFNKNIEFYPNEEKSYKEQFAELLEKLIPKNK